MKVEKIELIWKTTKFIENVRYNFLCKEKKINYKNFKL